KQHPGSLFSPVNKAITYYYIIVLDKKKIGDSLDGRIGPLTLEQFNLKRKELNIPEDLSFTIIRKKNE
ncbi:hypothetical protein LJC05_04975, partial [Bacteroides sp. OttesenSCG-928-J23]|nr:hypothetical protein [Bacteroides sp. OttesenSCG-928-J23]